MLYDSCTRTAGENNGNVKKEKRILDVFRVNNHEEYIDLMKAFLGNII